MFYWWIFLSLVNGVVCAVDIFLDHLWMALYSFVVMMMTLALARIRSKG